MSRRSSAAPAFFVAMAASALATSSALPARGAEPRGPYLHDGLYLRFAGGPALGQIRGSSAYGRFGDTGGGIGDILAIGGTIPGGLVIGGASMGLVGRPGAGSVFGPFVDWFPDPRAGWHVGGQLGLGVTVFLDAYPTPAGTGGSDEGLGAYGLGGTLFGGYDFWIAPQASVGLMGLVSTTTSAAADPAYTLTPLWGAVFLGILYH